MDYKNTIAKLLVRQGKNNGKLAVALLAGIALGGVITYLFSSKNILKIRKGTIDGGRTIRLKNSYTEMSNRLAN